ncbi:PQQ-like beta-propeller repeat protein [Streptomyces sp. ASQP_92]|uniref:PQQ-like beta-propeller repeat protein n=1 Tax=Streptomyces sp. ASQP_92 TaxID=2979116 RepID=UPI0021BF1EAE|nr:PQQ-like beta-propeller repeat protein [Streptomyces sp. ASQP_92]MCT9088365.1 PQQ-like beta-propeller repeat protein [Streptomyces sp. ASQP_92]
MERTRLALTAIAAVLALPLVTAARHADRAPYGDHFHRFAAPTAGAAAVRIRGAAVEAYDRGTGAPRWTYGRRGSRVLALYRAPGHAVALWADGMVTDTDPDARRVRWHRAVPGLGAWLTASPARAAGVLQPLDPDATMLAVVAPERVSAFRVADGDLRWLLPAPQGCAFDPARTAHTAGALLLARPCRGPHPWPRELVAVDGLGEITPGRTPLGNDLPGGRRADGGGNRVARPS